MKKNNELISVVVPVYNVENYVGKCLESIINQTYNNIEIIVVNDGSTDNSLQKVNEYGIKDKRVKIISKKNGGLSSARNAGIDIAKGKYIMFIDSDDFIELTMIETLYNNIKKYSKKISVCNRYYYYENGEKKLRFPNKNEIISMDLNESYENLLSFKNFDMSAWAKLYDIKLFEDIRFPEGKLCEDYYIMYKLFDKTNGIVYDSRPLLYYLQQRKGSITKKSKLIFDYVYAAKEQMDFICGKYKKLENSAKSAYCLAFFTIYNKSIVNGGEIPKDYKKNMIKEVKNYCQYVYKNTNINFSKKLQVIIFLYFRFLYNFIIKTYKKLGD